MKNLRILSILCALVILFTIPANVMAEEAAPLTDPGTTPDSPFYFMDKWGKQISLAFTFNVESKAQKALGYADERMAEVEAMMAKNKIKETSEAAQEYQYYLQTATQNMEQANSKNMAVEERMALMTEKHLAIANRIFDNASEEAVAALTQNRARATECQETALKNMAQGDPEKAAKLNLQLMDRQLNRIQIQAEKPETEGLQQGLEEYNRLGKLGEKISQVAKSLGQETTVDQLVGQATAHHLEVLARVEQRVQGEAEQAVEAAIQNCVQNHEQLVTRLQLQNQLGPVPAETPVPTMLQNRTEQSTQTMTQTGTQTQAGQGASGTAMQTATQTQTQTNQETQGPAASTKTQTQTGQDTQNTSASSAGSTTGQGSSSEGSGQGR